jgi:predicted DsbA family dithiol-disulfide isomerase
MAVRLDIFSDPVCPWCHIGKAHLDRALARRPGHPFVIAWHPFQLNPEMPAGGMDRRAYLAAKFGAARVGAMNDRLRQAAAEAGVDLDPERPARMPNTLDAHRVIHWAGLEGVQTAVKAALMAAYWGEGADIGDPVVLAAVAGGAGMDASAVARLLATDADRDDIAARDADARAKGVTAVPTFLIDRRYAVQGAQPPELWAEVIDEIAAMAGTGAAEG